MGRLNEAKEGQYFVSIFEGASNISETAAAGVPCDRGPGSRVAVSRSLRPGLEITLSRYSSDTCMSESLRVLLQSADGEQYVTVCNANRGLKWISKTINLQFDLF